MAVNDIQLAREAQGTILRINPYLLKKHHLHHRCSSDGSAIDSSASINVITGLVYWDITVSLPRIRNIYFNAKVSIYAINW